MRSYRPLIIGRRGAVAANHPLAAQAGLLALRAGGNAVDAAVATAVGARRGRADDVGARRRRLLSCLRASDRARGRLQRHRPRARRRDPERYAGGIPRIGPLSVSVPGMLAGLDLMHRRFGRLPWHDLFAEAIGLCPRWVCRHPRLQPLRRGIPRDLGDRPVRDRDVPDGWQGAGAGRADRPARSRPDPRRDRGRRGRKLLPRQARRGGSRPASKPPERWSGPAISQHSRPRSRSR